MEPSPEQRSINMGGIVLNPPEATAPPISPDVTPPTAPRDRVGTGPSDLLHGQINRNIGDFHYVPPDEPDVPADADTVPPTVLDDLPPPPTPEGIEHNRFVRDGLLSVNGLITIMRLRKRAALEERMDRLQTSQEVHKEMPDVFGNRVVKESWMNRYPQISPDDALRAQYRNADPALRPLTLSQTRQELRNGRRQSRANVLRSTDQWMLRQKWGDDIGTPGFLERIGTQRLGPIERRRAIKDHNKFLRTEAKVTRNEGRVQRSAKGEDIPGRVIAYRREKTESKLADLEEKLPEQYRR